VYETPGGTILFHALRAVESITLDRQVAHLRDELAPRYAEMVYNGFWFAPERYALQTLFDEMAESVTGEARLSLFKGTATVVGRRAPFSLYDPDRATFEEDKVYDQADAGGFIRINSLRVRPPAGAGEG
ncbi:MAG: argininosuccinate synthase, partial [Acidimicrobiia bacterium]|nr:argininosuccinate synthase [Acidimicrobiia bacterium]